MDLTQRSDECDCTSIFETTSARFLDTSLLAVSQQIRQEAFKVLLERNHFHLDTEGNLWDFKIAFKGLLRHVRSCSVSCFLDDEPLEDYNVKYIRKIWLTFPALQKLTVYARVCKTAGKLFEEGVLNHLRPLASLPLTSFNLHFPDCGREIPQAVARRLSLAAKNILLKDPTLPEEEQVKPRSSYWKVMKEKKPQKFGPKDFVPSLVSGKM